ncbi:MAG: GNAT family N-acetyltransferase [Sphingomonas sp.]
MTMFALHDDIAAIEPTGLARADQPSLHDRLDWLRLHARHGCAPGAPRIACAREGDARAWLFLADEGRGRATACASWYTLAFAPVFHGGDAATRERLLAGIARGLRGRFGRIMLAPMADAARDATVRAFHAAGWWAESAVTSANWVAHVGGEDFAAYWARRPSRLRNTARRKARDATLSIAIHDGFDAGAWAAYEAVYAASWKPAEGSPAFLRALAEQEGAAGALRLGVARRGGRPVAAQMWTVEAGVATIHKLAYDEGERARSPGTVLSEAMFAHVITRDRPRTIDFGAGDDAYKADWMDEKRPLHRLTLHDPRSLTGLAAAARARLARMRR